MGLREDILAIATDLDGDVDALTRAKDMRGQVKLHIARLRGAVANAPAPQQCAEADIDAIAGDQAQTVGDRTDSIHHIVDHGRLKIHQVAGVTPQP